MSEIKTIVATSADGLSRREFTLEACLAILSGVIITVSEGACGGSSYSSPSGPSGPPTASGDKVGDISNNHGHTATITAAQLAAGNAVTVELTLGSGHTHTLSLGADQVVAIAANQRVSGLSSTNSGHNHTVTFN